MLPLILLFAFLFQSFPVRWEKTSLSEIENKSPQGGYKQHFDMTGVDDDGGLYVKKHGSYLHAQVDFHTLNRKKKNI